VSSGKVGTSGASAMDRMNGKNGSNRLRGKNGARETKKRGEPFLTGEEGGLSGAEEFIGGKHAVLSALQSGRPVHKLWIADSAQKQWADQMEAAARQAGVTVQYADRRRLDQLIGHDRHQGVIAQIAAYEYADVGDILERARASEEHPFILVLDEIEDPHNLGSILRTADCAGAHGVIIPKRRAVGLTQAVAKTSAGAVEHVPVARVTNIAQTLESLKKEGIWTIAAAGEGSQLIHELDLNMPLALVIGNEHRGIGRLVMETCDLTARIPMYGKTESLNASVAAGILMYEVVRQRKLAGGARA